MNKETPQADKHPVMIACAITRRYGPGVIFEFSRYKYVPQTVSEDREIFSVSAAEVGPSFLSRQIRALRKDQELAFHSKVTLFDGTVRHLPMVDFADRLTQPEWKVMRSILSPDVLEEFYVFDSGRSFHGYGLRLLTEREWVSFMGTLLLLNLPGESAIVDARWVGHRLISGYSSLRWSRHTNFYTKTPELYCSTTSAESLTGLDGSA